MHYWFSPSVVATLAGRGAAGRRSDRGIQDTLTSPLTKVWQAMRYPCCRSSSVRCLRSFGLTASVCAIPLSIRHRQVPHSPPPHLKGMPPCSRSETRSRLLFSGASTVLLLFVMKVTLIIVRSAEASRSCRSSRLAQARLHVTEGRQMFELLEGAIARVEFFQEFAWHVVDDLADLLDHADAGIVFDEFGDNEVRLLLAIEQIVVGLERLQAVGDLGPELAGLAGQDHIHGTLAVGFNDVAVTAVGLSTLRPSTAGAAPCPARARCHG